MSGAFQPPNSMTRALRAVPIVEPDASGAALGKPPTPADAWNYNTTAYQQWVAQQRAAGISQGVLDPQTGWPTQAGLLDAAQQFGSALLGATAAPGSASTQIAGTVPMYRKAIQHLMETMPHATSVLDYGAGLGLGADAMRAALPEGVTVHSYEPSPGRWQGATPPTYTDDAQINRKYDLITNTNVLNVLPRSIRDDVVRDIGDKLAPGGRALVTTRGWSGDVAATRNATPADEPNAIFVQRPGQPPVFQKGFSTPELLNYVGNLLGKEYSVAPAPFGKAGVLITRNPQAP
jgi:SAM-dependent methyltransferase